MKIGDLLSIRLSFCYVKKAADNSVSPVIHMEVNQKE